MHKALPTHRQCLLCRHYRPFLMRRQCLQFLPRQSEVRSTDRETTPIHKKNLPQTAERHSLPRRKIPQTRSQKRKKLIFFPRFFHQKVLLIWKVPGLQRQTLPCSVKTDFSTEFTDLPETHLPITLLPIQTFCLQKSLNS